MRKTLAIPVALAPSETIIPEPPLVPFVPLSDTVAEFWRARTPLEELPADVDAARETAVRLRASTAEAADRAVKIAGALGFVGEDAGLLELVRETEATPHPFILRLGGVSAWRLGRGNEALALWQAAQRLDPDDELVRDALTDLKRPVGYREGPTAFPLQEWVS